MKIKDIGILAVLAAGMLTCPLSVSAQEVIFIVRHSDPPAVLNLDEIKDETPLSESGQQRAGKLAERLKDAGITAIYATQARRTVEPPNRWRKPSASRFAFIPTKTRTGWSIASAPSTQAAEFWSLDTGVPFQRF